MRKSLAAALIAAAVSGIGGVVAAVGPSPFSDTSGHEHETEIELANSKGLFQGYVDKTFRPDQTLTNRQSEVVLGRLLDRYNDDEGNNTLTRAQAAVVLTRGVCGLDGDCETGPVARVDDPPGEEDGEPPPPTAAAKKNYKATITAGEGYATPGYGPAKVIVTIPAECPPAEAEWGVGWEEWVDIAPAVRQFTMTVPAGTFADYGVYCGIETRADGRYTSYTLEGSVTTTGPNTPLPPGPPPPAPPTPIDCGNRLRVVHGNTGVQECVDPPPPPRSIPTPPPDPAPIAAGQSTTAVYGQTVTVSVPSDCGSYTWWATGEHTPTHPWRIIPGTGIRTVAGGGSFTLTQVDPDPRPDSDAPGEDPEADDQTVWTYSVQAVGECASVSLHGTITFDEADG